MHLSRLPTLKFRQVNNPSLSTKFLILMERRRKQETKQSTSVEQKTLDSIYVSDGGHLLLKNPKKAECVKCCRLSRLDVLNFGNIFEIYKCFG